MVTLISRCLLRSTLGLSISTSTNKLVPPIPTMLQYSTNSSDEEVIVENINNKKILTLNRPKALNALSLPMIRKLTKELKGIDHGSDTTEMVILKGAGGKAFCAGGDVLVTKSFKEGTQLCKDFFREEYKLNYLIGTLKVPFVSLMDGITMGGGCGLSINGSIRVATERTVLAMPETALGLFPDVGATHFLSRLPNSIGMFLALTGFRLKAADVMHSGMATHYVESEHMERLIDTLVHMPNREYEAMDIKEKILAFGTSHRSGPTPGFTLGECIETINNCFGANTLEDVIEKLKKEGGHYPNKFLDEIIKMTPHIGAFNFQFQSPTSLKVTFQQVKQGANLKFSEVFPIEYRLTQRFLAEHDFHEGCRAILVDKDRKPKWQPDSIDKVSQEKVDWYFSKFENEKDELRVD